jgi:anti-sigma B factor antagonist
MSLHIETSGDNEKMVLAVRGDVDLYTSPELRTALLNAISTDPETVAVRLGDVTYMDSSGIATLIQGLRTAREKKIAFLLVAPSKSVMRVMQIAKFDTVFEIRDHL